MGLALPCAYRRHRRCRPTATGPPQQFDEAAVKAAHVQQGSRWLRQQSQQTLLLLPPLLLPQMRRALEASTEQAASGFAYDANSGAAYQGQTLCTNPNVVSDVV